MMSFQPGCSRVCVSSTITDCIAVLLLARGVLVTLLNMKLKAANYFRKTFPLKYLPGTQIHKYPNTQILECNAFPLLPSWYLLAQS